MLNVLKHVNSRTHRISELSMGWVDDPRVGFGLVKLGREFFQFSVGLVGSTEPKVLFLWELYYTDQNEFTCIMHKIRLHADSAHARYRYYYH